MFRIPKILVEKIQKTLRTLNYVRQTNRETKENQRDKKGKMLLLFNKVGKGCVLDKGRTVVTEVSFITEVYFFFFLLIISKRFIKSSGVKCILSITSFRSLIDLT